MIEDLWYRNAVFYSLDLETFLDSDGDGVGDFEGLIRRLDYLEFLGIDCVWLAPFQPTPNRDNGYDISDYYGVDPRHGSSGDFVQFIHEAKNRGIRVIMDLAVNHTSDQHPWFQNAREGRDAPFHDWYVWADQRPEHWNEGMVFPGFQDAIWTYDRKAKRYYFHRFYEFQPDLNLDNPAVREEIRRIMGFWLQLGVDGFRLDAVPFMLEIDPREEDGTRFEYLEEFRRFLSWRNGSAILLGEANVPPEDTEKYFADGARGLHLMFNFWVNQHLFLSLATEDTRPLREALEATREIPEMGQWAHFLRNHDELDLGRLTDEERQTVFDRFAPEERMHLYDRGIRRRLAPMLADRAHEELAYSVMFSLPGAPVIRFGDELRMGDDLSLEQRAAVRTPMQWADEPQAGFSASPDTIHPVIDEGPWSYHSINVAGQRRDEGSFLNWTARMIRLRRECPEVGWGEWQMLDAPDGVLALQYDWRGNCLITLHNFSSKPCELRLTLDGDAERLSDLLCDDEVHADEDGAFVIRLAAYGYRWFRLGGLDYAVRRQSTAHEAGRPWSTA